MRLKAEDIGVKLSDRVIVDEITLTLRKGEIVAILGPNGSGKTTLLKTIFGLLKPYRGVVYVDGKVVHELARRDVAKFLGYLPQEIASANLKVLDIVLFGRIPHAGLLPAKSDKDAAIKALKLMGLEGYEDRNFNELSGGEKQKVMLARIFCQEADFLLLDEPTAHLDIKSQIDVMKMVKSIVAEEKGALVALHDINLAAMFADRILMVKKGRVKYSGKTKDVLTPENIKDIYGIDVDVLRYNGNFVVVPRV